MQLTIKDVIAIGRTVRTTKTWTRREAWYLRKLTDERLKAHARGELVLAPDVRIPLAKVVEMLWRVRKIAQATWRENVACDREGLPPLERAAQ